MDTGSPLIMLIGPLAAAVAALLASRYRRVSLIIGLVALALLELLLLLSAPGTGLFADSSMSVMGREVVLTAAVRSLFLLIYPATAVLLALVWVRPAGRAFAPVALAVLSPLAAALMAAPAGLGAVALVAAAAVTLPALHGGRFEAAATAWRYFLIAAAALAPLLIITSGTTLGGATGVWLAPLLATLMLTGAFPFHAWLVGLARRAPLPALILVLAIVQLVVVVYLLNLLDTVPAARASLEFQTAARWSAALTGLVAAFHVARTRQWRGLVAGLLLLDAAFLPLAVLAPGSDGLLSAMPALIGRYLGLLLVALALSMPLVDSPATPLERLRKWLRPAALLYGCLTLIGLPLTPGFAGRWAQLAAASQGSSPWPPLLLALALVVVTFGALRAAVRLPVSGQPHTGPATPLSQAGFALALVLVGLAALFGIFPDWTMGLAARALGLG